MAGKAAVDRRAASLIQTSIAVPPQLLLMMPTGTPRRRCRSRPKKYPIAVNSPAVCGVAACQPDVFTVSAGVAATLCTTVRWRSSGLFAAAISPAAFCARRTGHSMFDWPDASQTSPTTTSRMVTVFFPVTTSSAGSAEAGTAASVTRQRPLASVVVLTCWPLKETVTCSPASARPQTGRALSRCSTAWSWNSGASVTSARTAAPRHRSGSRGRRIFLMVSRGRATAFNAPPPARYRRTPRRPPRRPPRCRPHRRSGPAADRTWRSFPASRTRSGR